MDHHPWLGAYGHMFCAVGFLYIYDRELDIKQSDFYDFGSLSMQVSILKSYPTVPCMVQKLSYNGRISLVFTIGLVPPYKQTSSNGTTSAPQHSQTNQLI